MHACRIEVAFDFDLFSRGEMQNDVRRLCHSFPESSLHATLKSNFQSSKKKSKMTTKVATIRSAPVSASTKNMDINVNVPSKLTSSPLQHAARSGMFVKLHVKDGCGKGE